MTDVPPDDDEFLDFLPEFRGSKIVYLTAILLIPPLTQTTWLFYLKLRHPIILTGKEDCCQKINNAMLRFLCCVKVLEKRAKDYKKGETWEGKKKDMKNCVLYFINASLAKSKRNRNTGRTLKTGY